MEPTTRPLAMFRLRGPGLARSAFLMPALRRKGRTRRTRRTRTNRKHEPMKPRDTLRTCTSTTYRYGKPFAGLHLTAWRSRVMRDTAYCYWGSVDEPMKITRKNAADLLRAIRKEGK